MYVAVNMTYTALNNAKLQIKPTINGDALMKLSLMRMRKNYFKPPNQ